MARDYSACPRCGAKSDDDAATMCRPHGDDCPMSGPETTFEARLAFLEMAEKWEPSAEEIAALDSDVSARNSGSDHG